jgi:hypothetical protein
MKDNLIVVEDTENIKSELAKQPIQFMKAVQAFYDGAEIYDIDDNGAKHYYKPNIKLTLVDENGDAVSAEEIFCWKWFIKND